MLRQTYNYATLFTWNPRSIVGSYTNSGGSAVTLPMGTVFGQAFAGTQTNGYNTVLPSVSTATDGSQDPIGLLAQTITVAAGVTVTVTLIGQGDIAQGGVIFNNGTDTLWTEVTIASNVEGTYYSRMIGKGMWLVPTTEGTYLDN